MTDEENVGTPSEEVLTEATKEVTTATSGTTGAADQVTNDTMEAVEQSADEALRAVEEASDKALRSIEEAAEEMAGEIPVEAFDLTEETEPRPEEQAEDTHRQPQRVAEDIAASLPEGEAEEKDPPKKSKKALVIGILLAIIAACLIGGFFYIRYFVPREIHVSEKALDLKVGETAKLSYSILPESADNLEVVWATSNDSIASIDEYGVVTALAGGRCAVAVATGNGKTDVCIVTVTDPAQVQKESLGEVRSYIESQDTVTEDALHVLTVRQIDDEHSFLIGEDGTDLCLIYRTTGQLEELGVDAQYSTYVRLIPEEIERAEVTQSDTLKIYDFPISMTGMGSLNLESYQYGDAIALTGTASTVDGLDASDALHDLTNSGVATCLNEFAAFLNEQNFGFGTYEFGLTSFEALLEATDEEAEPEAESAPEEEATSREEAAPEEEPLEDATLSDTDISADSAVESESISSETTPEAEEVADEGAVTDASAEDPDDEQAESAIFSEFPTAGPSAAFSFAAETETISRSAPVLIIAI